MTAITALPIDPCLLSESPLWHPVEQVLYFCDIPGRQLHRWNPATEAHHQWALDSEPGCCAALAGGGLLLALRRGLVRFDPDTGSATALADPPFDPTVQRFNDGKVDPQGRFWVGTIDDARKPHSALYCYGIEGFMRRADRITTSNGLAWSPDGRTMYWADTADHVVFAFDFEPDTGAITHQRDFVRFPVKTAGQDLTTYGGRPDGATVDAEGCYWVAMFEGARVLRFSPAGELLREVKLPVRCPTMPTFGGADLKTLYITSGREGRPADELSREPMAGGVLQLELDGPGGIAATLAQPVVAG